MKKIILFSLLLSGSLMICFAQHDVQYTNYNFSKLTYNPAYAGSSGAPSFAAIYRNQWINLEGAPTTLNANFHTSFYENKCGVGLSITADKIGMMRNTYVDLSYAYRFKTGDHGTMSLGINGRLEHGKIDWNLANPLDAGDETIPMVEAGRYKPNFGFGAYFERSNLYLGLSVPQLINSTLYRTENITGSGIDYRTYYLMFGYLMPLTKDVKFQPGVLLSFNKEVPFEADITANFIFLNTFWIGGNYRVGDSFDAIVQYQISDELRAGLSFDFTLSDLNKFTNGSIEFMVSYTFDKQPLERKAENINNLRYF